MARRLVVLALPLAPRTVPKSPDRGLTAAHPAAPYSPSRPNSHFKTLKRTEFDNQEAGLAHVVALK